MQLFYQHPILIEVDALTGGEVRTGQNVVVKFTVCIELACVEPLFARTVFEQGIASPQRHVDLHPIDDLIDYHVPIIESRSIAEVGDDLMIAVIDVRGGIDHPHRGGGDDRAALADSGGYVTETERFTFK